MGYRILFLDDEQHHVAALGEIAAQGGHEVIPLHSVEQGMTWLNTKDHIDVIVSCVHMQDACVFEFLKRVRQDPRHNWVQFVMLCSEPSELAMHVNKHVEQAAMVLGADKYVMMHEFNPKRLLKEIEASLPELPPQKDVDPLRDEAGVPRPASELPSSVNEAQTPTET